MGTELGITENNDIVVFDSLNVTSTDSATLNIADITNLIQYSNPIGVKGYINDSFYAHYPLPSSSRTNWKWVEMLKKEKTFLTKKKNPDGTNVSVKNTPVVTDSIALIGLMGNFDTLRAVDRKDWAAVVNAFPYDPTMAGVTRNFARREKLSLVVVPLYQWIQLTGPFIKFVDM